MFNIDKEVLASLFVIQALPKLLCIENSKSSGVECDTIRILRYLELQSVSPQADFFTVGPVPIRAIKHLIRFRNLFSHMQYERLTSFHIRLAAKNIVNIVSAVNPSFLRHTPDVTLLIRTLKRVSVYKSS
jgi:hypothetical protein